MPGGIYDSSKTRVRPTFDALWERGRGWLPELLALPRGGCPTASIATTNFALVEGYWHPNEKCLAPPVSLLSWMIRNVGELRHARFHHEGRRLLADGDPETVQDALKRLRSNQANRAWYIFEGPTCPDVYLVAEDALVVIEGKRTESSTTTDTTWLKGRHQIWRHLDAAWEVRGRRNVYGFFIVESHGDGEHRELSAAWQSAAVSCLSPAVLRSSFPHRSDREIEAIASCYLGITTWRHVCERFGIDWHSMPKEIPNVGA